MKTRDEKIDREQKEKRERKEKEFMDRMKEHEEELELQKILSDYESADYHDLISRNEFMRRRKYLFFQLRGKKSRYLQMQNDKILDELSMDHTLAEKKQLK